MARGSPLRVIRSENVVSELETSRFVFLKILQFSEDAVVGLVQNAPCSLYADYLVVVFIIEAFDDTAFDFEF